MPDAAHALMTISPRVRANWSGAAQMPTVRVPLAILKQQGGRKLVLTPGGMAPGGVSAAKFTLVKALARAFRWRRMMEPGHYGTIAELAAAQKINSSYVSRLLRLTLLAPNIVGAILDGRQPEGMTLPGLMVGLRLGGIASARHRCLLTRSSCNANHCCIMQGSDAPSLSFFKAAVPSPVRCAERGVAAPFTSPLLFATRLRLGTGVGIEVLVPNPAGREGSFVLSWTAATEAFQPSLADQALIEALNPLLVAGVELQPEHVRQAARLAAGTGLAGREARHAGLLNHVAARGLHAMQVFAHSLECWLLTCPIEDDRQRAAALALRVTAIADAATVLEVGCAQRTAWVVDGWLLLAILWRLAPAEARIAVLRRCLALAPPPADEMLQWPGCGTLRRTLEALPLASAAGFVDSAVCEAALAEWLAAP